MTLRYLFLALLSGSLGCAFWRPGPCLETASAAREQARQAVATAEAGDWKTAERDMTAAVAKLPEDDRLRRQWAEMLWQRGRREEAVAQMETAAAQAGDEEEVRVRLAEMRVALGNPEAATVLAEAVLRDHPDSRGAQCVLAQVAQQAGNDDAALAHYFRALAEEPCPRAEAAVAAIYLRQGRARRAASILRRVVERSPRGETPCSSLRLLATALADSDRPREARRVQEELVAREPEVAEHWVALAEMHLRLQRPADAQLALQRALLLSPHDARAGVLLAHLRQRRPGWTAALDSAPLK